MSLLAKLSDKASGLEAFLHNASDKFDYFLDNPGKVITQIFTAQTAKIEQFSGLESKQVLIKHLQKFAGMHEGVAKVSANQPVVNSQEVFCHELNASFITQLSELIANHKYSHTNQKGEVKTIERSIYPYSFDQLIEKCLKNGHHVYKSGQRDEFNFERSFRDNVPSGLSKLEATLDSNTQIFLLKNDLKLAYKDALTELQSQQDKSQANSR